jgi:MFS family permease
MPLVLLLSLLHFTVLLPAYAKEILHGSSDTLGYLMSALGAGALLAAIYMATRRTVLGLGRIISVSVGVIGLALGLASFSENLYFSLIVFFFGGVSMVLSLSSINTMLQTIADEDKRGRVMSFYAMALMGTAPIGNLLSGTMASGIGISYTLLISGTITVFSGIWMGLNLRSLRKYVRPIYINKGILPGLQDDLG